MLSQTSDWKWENINEIQKLEKKAKIYSEEFEMLVYSIHYIFNINLDNVKLKIGHIGHL